MSFVMKLLIKYFFSKMFCPLLFTAAQQYDRVFVCRCTESRSVEATLHQTSTPVQVKYMFVFIILILNCDRQQADGCCSINLPPFRNGSVYLFACLHLRDKTNHYSSEIMIIPQQRFLKLICSLCSLPMTRGTTVL